MLAPGNFYSLEGDSINLTIKGEGDLPDSIVLYLSSKDGINGSLIPLDKLTKTYHKSIDNLNSDIVYWTEYTNPKIISSWNKISTSHDTIIIKNSKQSNISNFNNKNIYKNI